MSSQGMDKVAREILTILDRCCDAFTFPMLDNGYVYLAATRLTLFRSTADWALVIEIFGFSPRTGIPDTHIYTFASRLDNRKTMDDYVNPEAHRQYLANNPHNESRFIFPIDEGPWQDPDDSEILANDASQVLIRGNAIPLPDLQRYKESGITLERPPTVHVYEACRYLAIVQRDLVLATESERRANVPPELDQIFQLEEWNHPNIVDDNARPSASETFQQLAAMLSTGDLMLYQPSISPNTHWINWPDGGTL